ncbi:MAG TPA: T9SS type A sorting domain-containing protein, partial [Bacteroidia bacterium]|nr:T9SS type A sorting domain-containing protein [Bacteroidia bacterium]
PLEGLQLTKQGYIKVAFYWRDSIGVILNPNAYGTACNYQTFPITFNGRLCKEQFPNFNTNYYNSNPYSCGIGIAETENTIIKYFPNPVSDRLTVTNLNRNYDSMFIYSIDGRYALFKRIDNKEIAEIDTHQLSSGIYFIQLLSKSSIIKSLKFIKLNF